MWEDLAFIVKDLFGFEGTLETTRDIGGSVHHLDIGCASGYLTKHLRRRGVDSYGCDFSEWALDHADEYVKPFVRFWDITSEEEIPNWSSVGWNLITCFETMEHIAEEHVPAVLSRMYDLLDPGGYVLLAICTNDRPGWDSDPTHVTIHDRDWWMDQLMELPWKIDGLRYSHARSFHLFAEHNGTFIMRKPLVDTQA
jgi:cyclopropane fatty-acyl-phospholipid synthase-like methyltransferase